MNCIPYFPSDNSMGGWHSTAEWFIFFYRKFMFDAEKQWCMEGRRIHLICLDTASGVIMWGFCPIENGEIRIFQGVLAMELNFKTYDRTVEEARAIYRLYNNDNRKKWSGNLIVTHTPMFT
jgi:hypothetical protein